jgi:hypothetical protein
MAEDQYAGTSDRWPVNHDPIDNPRMAFAVTKDDNKDLTNSATAAPSYAKALYVGGAGDIQVTMAGDKGVAGVSTPVLFKAVPVGFLNVQVRRVWSTNTTATSIVALMD